MKPEENNTSYSIVKDFEIFLDEVTDETSEDYDPAAAFDLEVMDRVYGIDVMGVVPNDAFVMKPIPRDMQNNPSMRIA